MQFYTEEFGDRIYNQILASKHLIGVLRNTSHHLHIQTFYILSFAQNLQHENLPLRTTNELYGEYTI